jgi:Dynactin p62 family
MAQAFPYTFYACPCVNTSAPLPILTAHQNRKTSREPLPADLENSDEEDTFDPRSPRSNFSLFPLETLLWCTECHQMRCARCMVEEVVCWYCPSCLFEVPSSTLRSEGNRLAYMLFPLWALLSGFLDAHGTATTVQYVLHHWQLMPSNRPQKYPHLKHLMVRLYWHVHGATGRH